MEDGLGAAQSYGAAVEGVAGHHTRQHRVSDIRAHRSFVHGDGVADEGGDTQRTGDTQASTQPRLEAWAASRIVYMKSTMS